MKFFLEMWPLKLYLFMSKFCGCHLVKMNENIWNIINDWFDFKQIIFFLIKPQEKVKPFWAAEIRTNDR